MLRYAMQFTVEGCVLLVAEKDCGVCGEGGAMQSDDRALEGVRGKAMAPQFTIGK